MQRSIGELAVVEDLDQARVSDHVDDAGLVEKARRRVGIFRVLGMQDLDHRPVVS